MDPDAVAKVLLVRSVEESAPRLIPGGTLVDAAALAGAVDEPLAWLVRRARVALASLPDPYHVLLQMTDALSGGVGIALGVSVLVGLLTNYLGPSQQIHALYNPITLLILWNLAVFAALGLRSVLRRRAGARAEELAGLPEPADPSEEPEAAEEPAPARAPRRRSLSLWLLRRSVPSLWVRSHRLLSDGREESAQMGQVARTFWEHWLEAMRPLLGPGVRRLLNVAAIGLALGAVGGMFVRGLFLDYHIVWRSTFVTDPETVATVLDLLVGLPALAFGRPLPTPETAAALMSPEGVHAREWIWLYAGAAGLFILVPRLVLAAVHGLRLRALRRSLDLDLDDPYFVHVLEVAREQRVDEIIAAIRTDVDVESARFADAVARYVCEALYDRSIVPRLERFRSEGGRLRDLEEAIALDCARFETELQDFLPKAQADFQRDLSRAVERTVHGRALFDAAAVGLGDEVHDVSSEAALATGRRIGSGLNAAVGTSVSGAVALVLATVSGGLGESLGVALLVALGATGPIGFLVGGLAGLVLAGGGYFLGRHRAADAIRSVSLPGPVVRTALRPKRLARLAADGRARCHDTVATLVRERLEPMAPRIAEQIWTQVKPLIGERQRVVAP